MPCGAAVGEHEQLRNAQRSRNASHGMLQGAVGDAHGLGGRHRQPLRVGREQGLLHCDGGVGNVLQLLDQRAPEEDAHRVCVCVF